MFSHFAHSWPATIEQAVPVQKSLRHQVSLTDEAGSIRFIAGVDVSHKGEESRCAIVLIDVEKLAQVESVTAVRPLVFPYVPGFLSFRELPVVFDALDRLRQTPDLLMVDGQGIAHPRRFGIACHLGVLTDLPSIGVAKSRLTGRFDEPADVRGAASPLMDRQEQIGFVLRSKERCNPLFISPGHRQSLASALDWTLKTLGRYRLPEPTRLADRLSKHVEPPGLFG